MSDSPADGRVRVAAAVTVIPAQPSAPGEAGAPCGDVQIAWFDERGVGLVSEVVAWRRMDEGPWAPGQQVQVTVQGRASADLRMPLHVTTVALVLTFDPADVTEVVVGPVQQAKGWRFGVSVRGALLAPGQ